MAKSKGKPKAQKPVKVQTTITVSPDTATLVEQLAGLIQQRDGRLSRVSKHEAVHQAVARMIADLTKGAQP